MGALVKWNQFSLVWNEATLVSASFLTLIRPDESLQQCKASQPFSLEHNATVIMFFKRNFRQHLTSHDELISHNRVDHNGCKLPVNSRKHVYQSQRGEHL